MNINAKKYHLADTVNKERPDVILAVKNIRSGERYLQKKRKCFGSMKGLT